MWEFLGNPFPVVDFDKLVLFDVMDISYSVVGGTTT